MRIEGTSSIGLMRQNNQDRFAIVRHPHIEHLTGCVVCDGVGGSKAGEVAASIAVEQFVSRFSSIESCRSLLEVEQWIKETLQAINHKIFLLSKNTPRFFGMSTTLVAIIISEFGTLYVNVGDSRVYLVNLDNQLVQVSRDHSLVYDMILKGTLTQESAKTHPLRNAVTNALGIYEQVKIELNEIKLPYKQLLLSTDGLHGYVSHEVIESILYDDQLNLRQKVIALINEAEKVGAPDNVTLVIIDKQLQGGDYGK